MQGQGSLLSDFDKAPHLFTHTQKELVINKTTKDECTMDNIRCCRIAPHPDPDCAKDPPGLSTHMMTDRCNSVSYTGDRRLGTGPTWQIWQKYPPPPLI